ncbi:MAG TPA: hypothetical protein VMH23_15445, partial [Bacteroidota bacterium]|nr:hypothetical protein [Bacteroidota bacterium]
MKTPDAVICSEGREERSVTVLNDKGIRLEWRKREHEVENDEECAEKAATANGIDRECPEIPHRILMGKKTRGSGA